MGRPKGATADKIMSKALRLAAHREIEVDGVKLRRINVMADKMVDLAMSGDVAAFKEIADRIEGKVAQRVEGSEEDGSIGLTFKTVYETK